ncbi:MAG: HmuY family protein [Myxococcota bacterium]
MEKIASTTRTLALLVLFAIGLAACGDSGPVTDVPDAITEVSSDGVRTTQINATDDERWVVFDFEDPEAVDLTEDSEGWELAFRRADIRLGPGVEVAVLEDRALDDVHGTPSDEQFIADDGEDYAFNDQGNWYNYNIIRHVLSPKERTYVVRSSEGVLYKLALEGYYDSEERSGFPSFRWSLLHGEGTIAPKECVVEETLAEVLNPQTTIAQASLDVSIDGEDTLLTLDASVGGAVGAPTSSFVYVDLASLRLVELSDVGAAADNSWHVAVKRTEWRTNSGDVGPGQITVSAVEGEPFETASMPEDEAEWREDDLVDDMCMVRELGFGFLETAVGQWYNYDIRTHTVSVKEDPLVYFVRDGGTGATWRFTIETYEAGVYGIRLRAQ